jgi:hypothetical protein
MIVLNFTDPVTIQLGSIAYPCSPVLMILNRMMGCVMLWYFLPVRQLDVALHPVAGFQLWMWGLKNDSTNNHSTSPLEDRVLGVIPLVPLFTVSF